MKVQTLCKTLGSYGCLAFCYARIATDGFGGSELKRDIHVIKSAAESVSLEFLDKDFFVNDAQKFIHYVNPLVKAQVKKMPITSLEEVAPYEYACVNFVNGTSNHWVWVKHGKVYYDPLDYSKSVAEGKPKDARIVTLYQA